MAGLISYGAYVPYFRLARQTIAGALGEGGGKGSRSVAAYDEDATSMGVEAARVALRSLPEGVSVVPERVLFSTAEPPYLDKTNATVIHAALDLPAAGLAVDMIGSVRSGVGAILAAAEAPVPTLVVLSDLRTGLSGGAEERAGGDAAAALVFGGDPAGGGPAPIAELVATASATEEFLDRWRIPGEPASRVWEERFGEHAYGPLAEQAFADALKQAGLTPGDVDHLIAAGLPGRAAKSFVRSSGVRPEAIVDDLTSVIGNPGVAQPGLLLAGVLDRAEPGQVIALAVLSDGVTVLLFRTTAALAERRADRSVAAQVQAGNDSLRYTTFLAWRGQLTKEPPRRPDPLSPSAPASFRRERYKFGFVGGRCDHCSAIHMPPSRVCVKCGTADRMTDLRMADVPGMVKTFTIDRLAYTPSPPLVAVVIDFDGGGRFRCQLTDADPQAVNIGDRVEMTFRRMLTANGIHNYFWKAKPIRTEGS